MVGVPTVRLARRWVVSSIAPMVLDVNRFNAPMA